MGRISKAKELFSASLSVLKKDTDLLALPFISGICALFVVATFGLPAVLLIRGTKDPLVAGSETSVPFSAWLLLFVAYFIATFVGTFFNSAMIFAANQRLSGEEPSVQSALDGAKQHVVKILQWSLISTTVSVAIRQLEQRLGLFGKLFSILAGTAWAVVSFLVLPILVIEGLGPVDALTRSAELVKKAWGENLAGRIGMGIITALVVGGTVVVVFFMAVISSATLFLTLPVGATVIVATLVVMSALSMIFQTALYRHSVGLPIDGFDSAILAGAFTSKENNWRQAKAPEPDPRDAMPEKIQLASPPPKLGNAGKPPTPTAPPAAPPTAVDFEAPQDWSKLPDEWT